MADVAAVECVSATFCVLCSKFKCTNEYVQMFVIFSKQTIIMDPSIITTEPRVPGNVRVVCAHCSGMFQVNTLFMPIGCNFSTEFWHFCEVLVLI